MGKVIGKYLGLALCKALSIDPEGIRDITLTAHATDGAMITIVRYMDAAEVDVIGAALGEETFELVPKPRPRRHDGRSTTNDQA